jgi:aspartyl-tRNA(Asn)/glutamyl-tRNA(Gln) amidotransferase subunit A
MYFQEYHAPGLSAEVCNAWQEAADMFDKAGAKVTQVSLPYTEYSINCYALKMKGILLSSPVRC